MVNRVTYRRRHAYNTRSNKVNLVKTPGGKLVVQYATKTASRPRCGDCGKALPGMAAVRPKEAQRTKKRQRHVTRAYGGSRCANCVRDRIVRAFIIEEQKIVKNLQKQAVPAKKKTKKTKKSKKSKKRN